MPKRPFQPQAPSPLDGYLHTFLDYLDTLPAGFASSTTADVAAAAEACNVSEPFIEALYTSASTRGLIEPFQPRGSRGRNRWRVSARGNHWRSTTFSEPAPAPASPDR
jgi:hypothetical protein